MKSFEARIDDWKLLNIGPANKKKTALFNLSKDISEKTNLAPEHPEIVTRLTTAMEKADAEITANTRPVWGTMNR